MITPCKSSRAPKNQVKREGLDIYILFFTHNIYVVPHANVVHCLVILSVFLCDHKKIFLNLSLDLAAGLGRKLIAKEFFFLELRKNHKKKKKKELQ